MLIPLGLILVAIFLLSLATPHNMRYKTYHVSAGKIPAGTAMKRFQNGTTDLRAFTDRRKLVSYGDLPEGSRIVVHSPHTRSLSETVKS